MKYILPLITSLLLLSCATKISVKKFDGSMTVTEKFFYTLPANTIDVECKIKKESYTRGPLFDLTCATFIKTAVDSFGLDKAILDQLATTSKLSVNSLVKDGFSWTEGAIPDTSKVYVFNNTGSWRKDESFTFAYNRDWMISSATISSEDRTFDIVSSFVSSVTATAGAIFKGSPLHNNAPLLASSCDSVFFPLLKAKKELQQFLLNPPALDGDGLTMSKDARTKAIEKLMESIFYKKEEEVSIIRFSLLIPDSFKTDQQLKFIKVDKATGALIINETLRASIIWPVEGNKIGCATPLATDAGWLTISSHTDARSAQYVIGDKLLVNATKGSETGIVYNVPRLIRFYLKTDDETIIANSQFAVAQLGKVNMLSQKISKSDFKLDSLTGSLTSITLERKSIAASRITSAGAMLQQVDSTSKKKTELQKLKDEADELDLRVKIKENKAKLE